VKLNAVLVSIVGELSLDRSFNIFRIYITLNYLLYPNFFVNHSSYSDWYYLIRVHLNLV